MSATKVMEVITKDADGITIRTPEGRIIARREVGSVTEALHRVLTEMRVDTNNDSQVTNFTYRVKYRYDLKDYKPVQVVYNYKERLIGRRGDLIAVTPHTVYINIKN